MVDLYIDFYKIDMHMKGSADVITDKYVEIHSHSVETGEKSRIESDDVLLAVGYDSVNTLYQSIKDNLNVKEIYHLGDYNHVANIYYAIHEAYEVENNI